MRSAAFLPSKLCHHVVAGRAAEPWSVRRTFVEMRQRWKLGRISWRAVVLGIAFPLGGAVYFVFHADSPRSAWCIPEYIGIPMIAIPVEIADRPEWFANAWIITYLSVSAVFWISIFHVIDRSRRSRQSRPLDTPVARRGGNNRPSNSAPDCVKTHFTVLRIKILRVLRHRQGEISVWLMVFDTPLLGRFGVLTQSGAPADFGPPLVTLTSRSTRGPKPLSWER